MRVLKVITPQRMIAASSGTTPPTSTSTPVVDSTMTRMLDGITVAEMDYITPLKMEAMFLLNALRTSHLEIMRFQVTIHINLVKRVNLKLRKVQLLMKVELIVLHQSEDTLIDIYLSGSSKYNVNPDNSSTSSQNNKADPVQLVSDENLSLDLAHNISLQYVESEFSQQVEPQSNSALSGTDVSREEENWLAQYGMVVRSDDEVAPSFPIVDLWDWEMVTESVKKRQPISRLIGRLVKSYSKLHPSVPSGGCLLKTTAIHEIHVDLVRVSSGKIYRLRNPSQRYLASISTYDSSNPTKGWSFPDLYANLQSDTFNMSNANNEPDILNAARDIMSSTFNQNEDVTYRDRAAERRMLHGGFGIGPGQKVIHDRSISDVPQSLEYSNPEEAAAEAMDMSFGKDSYARRILETMGWKEGQALGSSRKGILEPLQAVSNKGNAGLGWKNNSGDSLHSTVFEGDI